MTEKKVAGDWYDIKDVSDNPFKLGELFKLTESDLDSLAGLLRLSVEEGVVEYKQKIVFQSYAFVETQKYDSRKFDDIIRHISGLHEAIYVTMHQRLLALGILQPRKRQSDAKPDDSLQEKDVKSIIEDVQSRIGKDPELRKNRAVKNILMQVSIYKNELANLKDLAPKIPKEKSESFYSNFRNSFDAISKKIQDNYVELLTELDPPKQPESSLSIFTKYDLKPLAPFFLLQAKELANLWSVLSYAAKERYKTREILNEVPVRDRVAGLVERELKEYERIAFQKGKEVAREFGWEIIYLLNKQRGHLAPADPGQVPPLA